MNYISYSILGIIACICGISTLIWKPYNMIASERLVMRRGLLPFAWWLNPPANVLLSVYVFNVTNGEEFLSGQHDKLKLKEVGPIIYREELTHNNVEFHDNNTMSYTATRRAVYLPELNTIDLNSTIFVPNFALLGMISFLWNASFPLRTGFNLIAMQTGSKPIVPISIQDYLWNFTDPVVGKSRKFVPSLVPRENFALLHQIYEDSPKEYSGRYNVHIGREEPRKFFHIESYNGRQSIGVWNNASCDSLQGSTEGILYHQQISRDDILLYFRSTFCRIAPLLYTGDDEVAGMKVLKFVISNETYSRPKEGKDCYLSDGIPSLPSGLTDISPCYYNFPVAASSPHLLNGDLAIFDKIEGLKPDVSKHLAYVYVEPNLGVPLKAAAKSQINLVIRQPKSGFYKYKRFFNMTIPLFWTEYKQDVLPWELIFIMYLIVVITVNCQLYFSIFLIALSLCFFYTAYRKKSNHNQCPNLNDNVIYSSLTEMRNNNKA